MVMNIDLKDEKSRLLPQTGDLEQGRASGISAKRHSRWHLLAVSLCVVGVVSVAAVLLASSSGSSASDHGNNGSATSSKTSSNQRSSSSSFALIQYYAIGSASVGNPGSLSKSPGQSAVDDEIPISDDYDTCSSVDDDERVECGDSTTPVDQMLCEGQRCCWDDSLGVSTKCFYSNSLEYTISPVTATLVSDATTTFSLYVDAFEAEGIAVDAAVEFDCDGDGTVDFIQGCEGDFDTDSEEGYEEFTCNDSGTMFGGTCHFIDSGRVTLRVWMDVGDTEAFFHASDPEFFSSTITIPFTPGSDPCGAGAHDCANQADCTVCADYPCDDCTSDSDCPEGSYCQLGQTDAEGKHVCSGYPALDCAADCSFTCKCNEGYDGDGLECDLVAESGDMYALYLVAGAAVGQPSSLSWDKSREDASDDIPNGWFFDTCAVPSPSRVVCGGDGIDQIGCEAKGCCWADQGSTSCFQENALWYISSTFSGSYMPEEASSISLMLDSETNDNNIVDAELYYDCDGDGDYDFSEGCEGAFSTDDYSGYEKFTCSPAVVLSGDRCDRIEDGFVALKVWSDAGTSTTMIHTAAMEEVSHLSIAYTPASSSEGNHGNGDFSDTTTETSDACETSDCGENAECALCEDYKCTDCEADSDCPSGSYCVTTESDYFGRHYCYDFVNLDCSPDCSFTCACLEGYVGDGYTCVLANECVEGTHECDEFATCTDFTDVVGYDCVCGTGFVGNGFECEDLNECSDSPCAEHATCENTAGSFECTCFEGFAGNGLECEDVNECENHGCSADAVCTNTEGSFLCECNTGFQGDGLTCTDINECDSIDLCDSLATCHNSLGSFECVCNEGFAGDGFSCLDIDECDSTSGAATCQVGATCENTFGSFECLCNGSPVNTTMSCDDVDECAEGIAQCGSSAHCVNTAGAYSCVCDDGFYGDGLACTDVDECAESTPCAEEGSVCVNTEGSYSCACAPGYEGDGIDCVDVDECSFGVCPANATCTNTAGSFGCECDEGFEQNGMSCDDVDECSTYDDICGTLGNCHNTDGSYQCTCGEGYTWHSDVGDCVDIDECELDLDSCDEHSACANTIPGYVCVCADGWTSDNLRGFTSDGEPCHDVNECEEGTYDCDDDQVCVNTDGSYSCEDKSN